MDNAYANQIFCILPKKKDEASRSMSDFTLNRLSRIKKRETAQRSEDK